MDAQHSYPLEFVIRALQHLEIERGLHKKIKVDNDTEFISPKLKDFCISKSIVLEHNKTGTLEKIYWMHVFLVHSHRII